MANKKRLIDANAFRKSINGWKTGKIPKGELLWDLDHQPTVDAVEVVHGRWERVYEDSLGWVDRCNRCKEVEETPKIFCSHCGAFMDE